MAKCESRIGRMGCRLDLGHDEPYGPAEAGGDRPRRATPHVWAGRCDVCGADPALRPVIRVHEQPEGSGKFFHLCGRCKDQGGSLTSGMVVNGHSCACRKPATRWIESIQAFLCAACGPDLERTGVILTAEDFAKIAGPLTGLFPVRCDGDFYDLFEVRIAAGQITRAGLIRARVPFWDVLDIMEERARAQVTEAPFRATAEIVQ